MKKAGVVFLWLLAGVAAFFFVLAVSVASGEWNYPQTTFWPLIGFGLLMEGAGAMARGIGKDERGWKIAGGIELVLGLIFVLIARPLNHHTGIEFGSIPWSSDLVLVLSVLILLPQPIVHIFAYIAEHENDPKWKSPLELERERVLKTRFIKDDYSGVRETVSTGSAIGRSLVGGAIAGDLGAVIGAATAKRKTVGRPKAVFIVWYKDGTDAVKSVDMSSPFYKLYLEKLER